MPVPAGDSQNDRGTLTIEKLMNDSVDIEPVYRINLAFKTIEMCGLYKLFKETFNGINVNNIETPSTIC